MKKDNRKSKSTNISGLFIRDFNGVREIMRSIYLFGCYDKNDYINREGTLKFKTGTSEGNISRSKVEIEAARFQFLLGEDLFNAYDSTYHCDYSLFNKDDDAMLTMYRNRTFTRLNLQSYIFLLQIMNNINEKTGELEPVKVADIFPLINEEHEKSVFKANAKEDVSSGSVEPFCYQIAKSKLQAEIDELKELGYIKELQADNRTHKYTLQDDIFKDFTDKELEQIFYYLEFCARSLAIQTPFYFAKRKLGLYLKYEREYSEDIKSILFYRNNFIYNSLDNEIAMTLLTGIRGKKVCEIDIYYRDMLKGSYEGTMKTVRIIPVKIVHDLWTGKQDLLYYSLETQRAETYRLDLIYFARVKDDVTAKNWELANRACEDIHHTWRTFLRSPYGKEHVKICFNIPKSDEHNRHRLIFEGVEDHGGTLNTEGKNLVFEIDTLDADDMIPWICSFGNLAEVIEPKHLRDSVHKIWTTSLEQIEDTKPLLENSERATENIVEVKDKEDLGRMVFIKQNNFMFEAMTRLINDKVASGKNDVVESELVEAASISLGRDIRSSLLSFDDDEHKFYDLLGEKGNTNDKDKHYFIRVFKKVPILFNNIEKEAIVNAVYLPQAGYFLEPDLIDKIKAIIPFEDLTWSLEDVLLKNRKDYGDERTEELLNNVRLFQDAIRKKVAVICNINLTDKKYKKQEVYPMTMDYYAATDSINTMVYIEETDEIVNVEFDKIDNIKLTNKSKTLRERYIKWQDEHSTQAVLEIIPKKFAVDRIVRMFSYYNRKVILDPKTDIYTMQIDYFNYNEDLLQRDILSSGDYIRVKEPLDLKEDIHTRIKKAKEKYEK